MGRVVHLDEVRKFIRTTPAFRARDVELIVKDAGYTSLLLHNMAKKGETRRIVKGWYSTLEDPVVSVFAFKPAYVGLQEALSLRNLWEQETNVVLVSSRRVRAGVREIMGSRVIIHRINREYFFGFDYVRYADFFIPVSDKEKTLIDLVYFNEVPGRDVVRRIAKTASREKFRRYLERYPETFRKRATRTVWR